MRARARLLACVALVACSSCQDPVRARAEAELGPEDPAGPSENHRAGQPCLVCHDARGGAQPEMSVAGTIYETNAPGAPGAEEIEVEFVDALGLGPLFNPMTSSPSGNFFVRKSDWPDLTYPFKVRLLRGGEPIAVMTTTVNREGSCNFCHRPTPPEPLDDDDRERARRSVGQIFVTASAP